MLKVKATTAILSLTTFITIAAILINLKQEILAAETLIIFALIPLVLVFGVMIKNRIVLVLQFMLIYYALTSYILPLLSIVCYPWYLPTIPTYDGNIGSEANWALMALGDIAAVQIALILAGYKHANIAIKLKTLDVPRAVTIGWALIFINLFFSTVLGTGKYIDGEMAANPIAQLLHPQYVIFILMIYTLNNKVMHTRNTSYSVLSVMVFYVIITVFSGSRSGLVTLFLLYASAWLLWYDELRFKHSLSIVIIAILSIVFFIIASMQRGTGGGDLSAVFYHADNIYDAVAIYIVKRIGLHENLYQIANGLYNTQIYNEISFMQFFKSTFDLLMPGTYFPGIYSLSALNQVWLYNYDVFRIATDWASIAVGLYSVNYLYFGKFFGWLATILIVYLYAKYTMSFITKNQSSRLFFIGIYMLGSFQTYFLTSFGYEYLIRFLVMGAANIYFWHWLITKCKRQVKPVPQFVTR